MKNNSDTPRTSKDLISDLKSLAASAETMMSDSLLEQSSDAVTKLRDRFEATQKAFSDLYDGAKKKVASSAKCTDEAIRENPYQSIAIAAGLALVVGLLLGRRTKG